MFKSGEKRALPAVLLIDDDLVSREVMATVLTMNGYTVHTAAEGTASVQLLVRGECVPDLILMDAQMPGLSGARLIAELRAHSKARILAISASKPPDDVAAAADGFLLKPFGVDELQQQLEERDAGTRPSLLAAVDADVPVVDLETLAQLRDMMPEAGVRQIYAAIVADLGVKLKAMDLAIERGDNAEIRRIGHAIKGGCGMAGALGAARIGALIESGILDKGSNQLDNGARLLADLRAAAGKLERMLEAEFPA